MKRLYRLLLLIALTGSMAACMRFSTDDVLQEDWGPRRKDLSTRLEAIGPPFQLNQPMRVRLELKNSGKTPVFVDAQKANVNDKFIIRNHNGHRLDYIGEQYMTGGAFEKLPAGEIMTLFEGVDLAKQYPLDNHGRFLIQHNGEGIKIIKGEEIKSGEPLDLTFPSNIVNVEVTME